LSGTVPIAANAAVDEPSTTVPAGTVIAQSPSAGTSVPAGSIVTLVVSTGPEALQIPTLSPALLVALAVLMLAVVARRGVRRP